MSDKKTEVKKQPEEKKQMDLDLLGKMKKMPGGLVR